ncbi:PREDICTED: uncharacterized protein LOC106744962 [Dinoponera quadriceps]|uniref:Uncharacterized protein LOC106744962 n=1 Tax=Dinoponera quadriceps TaxID=609295 RepID=A0A6P3XB43_DINQU|nr:PREDICTED: uncharacterized protein LOC106744962 [Dinoponera quadriceps]
MLLVLSRILSRSNCILILVVSNLACSAPLKSRKRATNESERGFSAFPKILEIQLPLKIASKEDLVAWSKYVKTLVASKINSTSTRLKDISSSGAQYDKRVSVANGSGFKSWEMTKKASSNERRQGINYPARRLKEPPVSPVQSSNDMVIAYPLPVGKMKFTAAQLQEPFSLPTSDDVYNGPAADQQLYFEQYTNFDVNGPFQSAAFGAPETFAQPPAVTYLPLPSRPTDVVPYQNTLDGNVSNFEEPARLSTKNSLNVHVKALNNKLAEMSPRNRSRPAGSLLTFPFQAVITITRQLPEDTSTSKTKNRLVIRPVDEFQSYLEKNHTLTNESGRVNVIFDDFTTGTNEREQKKKNEKKKKGTKQQNSKKRQPFVLDNLLRTLGILRKLPKNTTEITTPVLSILRGTNQQKIQVAFEDTVRNQERNNETFAQQTDDDEEEGGSIQAILDLLPLAAPILEELSDPESDIDLGELLQGAIPLIEGLSDPNEEGGIDIPGVLVPLSQRLSEGADGQGSDSGAILGPLIQLIAPLIGPILGPLIGPLSRTSSGPGGKEGSGALITSLSGPLSEPGAYGQSILSNLIAGITATLSKELASSAGDSDIKSIVSAVVSGVLAGTSAGSMTASKGGHRGTYGNRDTYYAQTTYGQPTYGYDSYTTSKPEPNFLDMITSVLKEVLGAFLKLSATSATSSANLSGTSSSSSTGLSASSSESKEQQPTYGTPTRPSYAPPPQPTRPAYAPPGSTGSSYTTFTRRQTRPNPNKQIKIF